MRPSRVFLSVQSVPYRRPAGADPFTYREKRPLRFRASWWTRGTSTEVYQSKIVPSEEEAVRLARQWLARENKSGVHWIDTTDHPQRYGYEHAPVEKKTSAQLDAEIAEALSQPTRHGMSRDQVRSDIAQLTSEIAKLREGSDTADKRDRRQELIARLADRRADLEDLNAEHRRRNLP
jgi:septal ring factor EnvC (AmiA/AmiB activator)